MSVATLGGAPIASAQSGFSGDVFQTETTNRFTHKFKKDDKDRSQTFSLSNTFAASEKGNPVDQILYLYKPLGGKGPQETSGYALGVTKGGGFFETVDVFQLRQGINPDTDQSELRLVSVRSGSDYVRHLQELAQSRRRWRSSPSGGQQVTQREAAQLERNLKRYMDEICTVYRQFADINNKSLYWKEESGYSVFKQALLNELTGGSQIRTESLTDAGRAKLSEFQRPVIEAARILETLKREHNSTAETALKETITKCKLNPQLRGAPFKTFGEVQRAVGEVPQVGGGGVGAGGFAGQIKSTEQRDQPIDTGGGTGTPCQNLKGPGLVKSVTDPAAAATEAISNAIKQLQCTVANIFIDLFAWLIGPDGWVLRAAKVEDLGTAGQLGPGQTPTSQSGGSVKTGATSGTATTGGLGPTPGINPAAKSREGGSRSGRDPAGAILDKLKKKGSFRPLFHFVFGIRPAQATLSQELRLGAQGQGPAFWVVGAWRAVVTAVNSFAAIVLLVIAIANIAHINIDVYGFRRALPAMIIGIVLANFSMTLIRFAIDASNAASLVVVDAHRTVCESAPRSSTLCSQIPTGIQGVADIIAQGLGTALGVGGIDGNEIVGGTWAQRIGIGVLADMAGFVISVILLIVAALALFLIGAVLWVRIIVIYLLTILAPLALFFYPLPFPFIQEQAKKWLPLFINWTFSFPVIIFFLWLGTLPGQFTAEGGGSNLISFATGLLMLFLGIMAPFKMIQFGGAAMESLLKKGPGALYGGAWGAMGRLADNPRAGRAGRFVGRAFRATNLAGVPGAIRQRFETGAKMTEAEAKRSPIARFIAGPGYRDRKEMMSEHRDRWGQEADVGRLRDRLNQLTPGKQPISAQSLLNASSDRDFAAFADQGWSAGEAIEAQAVMRQLNNVRRNGQTPAIRAAADTEWNNLVSPTATPTPGQPFTLFMAGAQARGGQVQTPTERLQTMTDVTEIDPVEATAMVEQIEAQGGEAELNHEIDRGLGAVDGRGGGKVGTELQGIAPGARKRLASIMSGILDPQELRGVLTQDDEFKGLSPAQLTALMATQQQISPGVQAQQNLEQLRLKSGLGNLSEQQEFGRQHQGFEAPVVRGNIGRLDQALNLVNAQRELTPDFQRQLQGTLAGIQVKTTDPRSGNVRITSLDRTLGSAVLGDRTQLIRTLTNQRAGAQAVAANPGQGVDQIFRQQGTELVSRTTANQTTGQVVKLVGETAPQNIKTAIGQPNHPLRQNLSGTVGTNVRALLEQNGVKVQANNPEFNRQVNRTVEQLVGTIGNNLTPGQRVNAKQIQQQVELQMKDAVNKNFGQFLQGKSVAPRPAQGRPTTGGNKQRQAAAATAAAGPVILVPPGVTEEELRARGPTKGILRSAKELAKGRATSGGPTPTATTEGPKAVPTTEDKVVG